MELGIWGTLWANCALGTFFALPNVPIITAENEEYIQKADEDSSRQDHETQTCSFSDSDDESEFPDNAPDKELDDESSVNERVSDLQNNCFNSDSNSLNSIIDNVEETEKAKSKGKKTKSFQRNRYNREEYKCTICPYTCTTERAFLRHLRLHTEEEEKNGTQGSSNQSQDSAPRLSCPVCGKDRSGEAALNKHMLRHRDINRNFCCDICAFKTIQLKKLIQHRRMHTGERPHLCPHCVYRAARRDNLRSHVRRVHKKDNLTCDTFNPRGMLLIPTKSSVSSSSSTPEKSEEQE